jgi:hypothetical protein
VAVPDLPLPFPMPAGLGFDRADPAIAGYAEVIYEAVRRPSTRFVPVKSMMWNTLIGFAVLPKRWVVERTVG